MYRFGDGSTHMSNGHFYMHGRNAAGAVVWVGFRLTEHYIVEIGTPT